MIQDESTGLAPANPDRQADREKTEQKTLDLCYHHGMSTYQTDSRIDDYIQALPAWQQEMCRQVRDLVHAADPEVTETIKRTRQPYFTLSGNICALLATKDQIGRAHV